MQYAQPVVPNLHINQSTKIMLFLFSQASLKEQHLGVVYQQINNQQFRQYLIRQLQSVFVLRVIQIFT